MITHNNHYGTFKLIQEVRQCVDVVSVAVAVCVAATVLFAGVSVIAGKQWRQHYRRIRNKPCNCHAV